VPVDYTICYKARKNKRGGGVAAVFKKWLSYKCIALPDFKTFECIAICFSGFRGRVTLFTVYRPPLIEGRSNLNEFFNEMSDLMELAIAREESVYIHGDFNLHLDCDNSTTEKFDRLMMEFSLTQLVSGPTHISGHTLDVVITKQGNKCTEAVDVDKINLSDHYPIRYSVKHVQRGHGRRETYIRSWKTIDMAEFNRDLAQMLDANIRDAVSCVKLLDDIHSCLLATVDKHAPLKKIVVKDRPNTPWYTKSLRDLKRETRHYERRWRRYGRPDDEFAYRHCFSRQVAEVERTKRDYYLEAIRSGRNNQKATYTILNNLVKPRKCVTLPVHDSEEDLCNRFCKFFDNKIKTIRQELDKSSNSETSTTEDYLLKEDIIALAAFEEVNEDELKKIMMKMSDKTCPLDPVPTKLLKQCQVLMPFLTVFINLSLRTGTVPDRLKLAIIVPLLKKLLLDPEILSNFRPVSKLSFISKLIEKVVHLQFTSHLITNKLLDKFQSAYKDGHSTETALARVHNDITVTLDAGGIVILLLLDMTAAFDTIDHEKLLQRLEDCCAVRGTAHKWFTSYLTNRKQAVRINNAMSDWTSVESGVPQGSILGPVLFSVFMHPLGRLLDSLGLDYHVYADDTQVYMKIDSADMANMGAVTDELEIKMDTIRGWLLENKLKLNESKSELIVMSSPAMFGAIENMRLRVGDQYLEPSSCVKDLGILFDRSLNFENAISEVVKKSYASIAMIYRIRRYLDEESTKKLVHNLIMSRLDYANVLYTGLPVASLSRLQKVQNSAARMVKKVHRMESATPLMYELHWLPVCMRVKFKLLVLTHKAIHHNTPIYLAELLDRRVLRHPRTHQMNLLETKDYSKKTIGPRAFSVAAPLEWNTLPTDLRSTTCISVFKRKLKTFLFRRYYVAKLNVN